MQSRGDFLKLGRSLFPDSDHGHVNALAARCFEN